MKIERLVMLLAVLCGAMLTSVPASAAKKQSFDLYSWAIEGNTNFCYAILPSSKEPRTVGDIKNAKDQVCGGRDDLKRIMGQSVPRDSKIYWKVDEPNGFVLPERAIVNDLKRFVVTIPYKLIVPGPKK